MSKKFIIKGCPCCGEKAYWIKGNRDTKTVDKVVCLSCFLEIEGDYKPQSSVNEWNKRVADYYIKDSIYNIDGDLVD